jgi:sugar phosphate isomerase/epimerase
VHVIDSDGTLFSDETSTHVPLGQGLIPWDSVAAKLLAVPRIDWWCVDLCFCPNAWEMVEANLEAARALLARAQRPA